MNDYNNHKKKQRDEYFENPKNSVKLNQTCAIENQFIAIKKKHKGGSKVIQSSNKSPMKPSFHIDMF